MVATCAKTALARFLSLPIRPRGPGTRIVARQSKRYCRVWSLAGESERRRGGGGGVRNLRHKQPRNKVKAVGERAFAFLIDIYLPLTITPPLSCSTAKLHCTMSLDLQARAEGMGATHALPYKIALIVICFLALAVWNAFEVFINIFRRFRRYRGIYFYSLIAASVGIPIHAVGYFLRFYNVSRSIPLQTIMGCGGGMLMITGQSIVLWSRLHLISPGRRDRWLLCMILTACVIVQGGATILSTGASLPEATSTFLDLYEKWELFQVTWFAFQECLISGIYIYRTLGLMRSSSAFRSADTKRLFIHLMFVNFIIIAFDITVVSFQFANLFYLQTSWKNFAYAVKLKLEFGILQQLVDFTQAGFVNSSGPRVFSTTGPGGQGEAQGTRQGNTVPSRFGHSTYARMSEEGVGVPMGDMLRKTTEVEVTVEDDVNSERSTQKLRAPQETIV